MTNNIWDTINFVGPRLKWTKYYQNYWGTSFEGHPIEFWPSIQKFRYKNKFYLGSKGYRCIMGEELDEVDNPYHYNRKGIECIDAIEASMSDEEFRGYLKGNVLKYIWRYTYKDKPLEDLKKARWYHEKLISIVKKNT